MAEPRPLRDFVTLQRGQSYKGNLVGLPGPYLLGLGTIKRNGGFRADLLRTYGGDAPPGILLRPGDLYVSLKDVTHAADLLGAVAQVPDFVESARLTQDTIRLDVDDREIDRDFLYWQLRAPSYRAYCRTRGTGTTNLDLSRDDFLSYAIQVPGRPQQRAIAEVLGALDDKIAANTRIVTLSEALLTAEFDALGIDEDPIGDEGVRVDHLFELNPARRKPSADEPVYVDMQRLATNSFIVSDWTRRPVSGGTRFCNGDTVMARITPCLENGKVGYIDFLADGEVGIGSTEYIVLRSRVAQAVPLQASYFLATSPRFRANAVQNMSGSSGRQRVAATELAAFEIRSPDPAALSRFGQRAGSLFTSARSLANENRTLAATRDALLPALLSGALRVHDAEHLAETLA